MGWLLWVLFAVALAVGEVLTPGLFFLGPVALAAGAAAVADLLGAGAIGAAVVFIVCSVASLGILRPIARRHVHLPVLARTGTDADWFVARLTEPPVKPESLIHTSLPSTPAAPVSS